MSSIVSRRPSSRNHWNEAFWMSIRLGRSRTCSRREKDLRARGEATFVVKENSLPWDVRDQATRAVRLTDERGTSAQPVRVPDMTPPPQDCRKRGLCPAADEVRIVAPEGRFVQKRLQGTSEGALQLDCPATSARRWRRPLPAGRDRKSTRLNSSHIPLSRMPS